MNDRQLYRDPVNGKISGVCAGIANYFGLEIWLVRILVVTAALLSGTFLVLVAYIAFSLMLDKQPYDYQESVRHRQETRVKSKAWQAGQSAEAVLDSIESDLNRAEQRIRKVEAYVTSEAFNINREFNKL